jgi:hypothetical protein
MKKEAVSGQPLSVLGGIKKEENRGPLPNAWSVYPIG